MDYAEFREALKQRFLRYVKIYTTSNRHSFTTPSSDNQWDLLRLLHSELLALGVSEVKLTDKGYLLGTLPAQGQTTESPTIALLAHVDTADDFSGKDVKPICHSNYAGQVLSLPLSPNQALDPKENPLLLEKLGHEVITTSGDTLLGADDKAGVAIVMTIADLLLKHPEIPHGPIRICFNPDEEIGRGTVGIEIADLGAEAAYTFDGHGPNSLCYESFSADGATIQVRGVAMHPGTAKNRLVNAIGIAAQIVGKLRERERTPETADGREGFIHVTNTSGNASAVELQLILRDFELAGLQAKREVVEAVIAEVASTELRSEITVEFKKQYRNMRYWLENDMRPVEYAVEAISRCGLTPDVKPIRGGTDGSVLTERGLPTPNLGSASYNAHGPHEWTTVEDMLKIVEVGVEVVKRWAKK